MYTRKLLPINAFCPNHNWLRLAVSGIADSPGPTLTKIHEPAVASWAIDVRSIESLPDWRLPAACCRISEEHTVPLTQGMGL